MGVAEMEALTELMESVVLAAGAGGPQNNANLEDQGGKWIGLLR